MSTPQSSLNLEGVLEPPPAAPPVEGVTARPRRARAVAAARPPVVARPAAPALDDSGLPDSLVSAILGNESGGNHYKPDGTVKLGPPTRSGSNAVGKWQVMPDKPGGRYRTIGGRQFDLYDEGQNDEAGRAYLSEGYKASGGDEAGAKIYYFGGPGALNYYKTTGKIPEGDDGYTTFAAYVGGDAQSAAPALKLDGVLEPPLKLDGILEAAADDGVVSTESTVDSSTGRALALDDPRRRQRVDASTVQTAETPAAPPLRLFRRQTDPSTQEGRAARDARERDERRPGAYLEVAVPVGDLEHADGAQLVRDAYKSAAVTRGVPAEFFDKWVKDNEPYGYHLGNGKGEEQTVADAMTPDAYDARDKTLRVRLDASHLSKIVDDFKASRGVVARAKDWATSDETSAGEKVLDVAGVAARPVGVAGGYVARPFQATSAGVFAAARGHNPLPVAYNTLTTGETPAEGTNPVGNFLRDSALLNRINPRLGRVLGSGADILLDPANLIGLGLLGKGAKAVAGVGRLGRAAEEIGALGRSLGVLERGLVEARPLGLAAAGAGEGGDVAALEDRLSRVLEVTRKLKAGESLTPEETALHAEVRAAAEAAPSSAVRGEQLRYARERADFYEREAERLTNADAKANARAMADDYAREAERLGADSAAPPAEGYDVADARASRFQQPAPSSAPAPLWKRAASNARAAVQLPKVKAGFDLSATGRQGLAQALAHPTYLKEAFAEQVKAFASEDAFNEFAQALRNHPDFELMNKSGLFLSSVGPEAEEAFASKLAQEIPGVRASDRAYSAALDSVRTQAWDNYVAAVAKNPNTSPETYKAIAELVNISTGRGVVPILDRSALGKKIINALNVPFFSPRNTASKFNLISPARIVKNMASAETRPVAWLQMRDAMRGVGFLGTTLGLAHFAGADVGIDPRSSSFGKLRAGSAVFDLTGGEGFTVRYLASMARAFRDAESGKKLKPRETPTALTLHYLRSQLQPTAAAAVDLATGKTFEGAPVTKGTIAADLIVPFVVADAYKGWVDAGGSTLTDAWEGKEFKSAFGGASRALPGVLGVGVNFYDKTSGIRPRSSSAAPAQPQGDESGPVSESGGSDAYERRLSDVRGRVAADLGRGSAEASGRTGGPVRARLAEDKARARAEREGVEWADFAHMLHSLGVEVVP
jgi:hypothetical protein